MSRIDASSLLTLVEMVAADLRTTFLPESAIQAMAHLIFLR